MLSITTDRSELLRRETPEQLPDDIANDVTDIARILDDLLAPGVWLGRTAALHSAESEQTAPAPGTARYWSHVGTIAAGRRDLRATGPDGLPFAWSCWDICLAAEDRFRAVPGYRFRASTVDAYGVEAGARTEPHAVLAIGSRLTGSSFVADPYFTAGPAPLPPNQWVRGRASGPFATATVTCTPGLRDTGELEVRHIAYSKTYRYRLDGSTMSYRHWDRVLEAPGWPAVDARRAARTTAGALCIRVTELDADTSAARGVPAGTTETKLWDTAAGIGAPPALRWTHRAWTDAFAAADDLVTRYGADLTVAAARAM